MNFEAYKIKQGKIVIAYSDKNLSIGYLELNPGTELEKHSRSTDEQFFQIKRKASVTIFENNSQKEVVLREGDQLNIPANQYHIHANRGNEKSITMWKFEGDISEVINNIRKNNDKF